MGEKVSAEEICSLALKHNCVSISYTYTEPTIFFEYAYDTARIARTKGLKNNFVTNGYMTGGSLDMIAPYLDGANVDLKSFSEAFYKKVCGARLKPVLESITKMHELGIWVEVTTLIIPGLNDGDEELRDIARFLKDLGPETPWHVSRFHPTYRLTEVAPTPAATLRRAREIGLREGLHYVYTGNIPGDEGENTSCHKCGKVLISRYGFSIGHYAIKAGCCPDCQTPVAGVEV